MVQPGNTKVFVVPVVPVVRDPQVPSWTCSHGSLVELCLG